MSWMYLSLMVAFLWLLLLVLPWRPWLTRERIEAQGHDNGTDLGAVTVIIPARNEAATIEACLEALVLQGRGLNVIVVDDRSCDGTAEIARQVPIPGLSVLDGEPLPPGWIGKMWALEQGLRHVRTPLMLCIDADIHLKAGMIAALVEKMGKKRLHLVSAMVSLRMVSFWERMLMPAFVYFFKLLYPFRLSNSPFSRVAAAAGGCILIRTHVLKQIGGYHAIRDALIDDCALARCIKSRGYRIWIGLTRSAFSLRAYDHPTGIWNMVARSAFYQLQYSRILLLLTTLGMGMVFCWPAIGLLLPPIANRLLALAAYGMMIYAYLPILAFYGRSRLWAAALPLVSVLYLAMTWTSALRYWRGEGSAWKGRRYQ